MFLASNVYIKEVLLFLALLKILIFFLSLFRNMNDAQALGNEKTDCSGFSWIVSIMVNGFSECQSGCFIDSASQWEEQTHLAGILPTAKTAPRIYQPSGDFTMCLRGTHTSI